MKSHDKHDKKSTKKTYRSPRLFAYGDIREITQTGAAGKKNDTGVPGKDKTA